MRIAVIGGTGHIGSYLTPRLWQAGHHVLCVSRGQKRPYVDHIAWSQVEHVHLSREELEQRGSFGERIAALDAQAVIDLTCYHPSSAEQLITALRGRIEHFLHCGTIWVHGYGVQVPTTEDEPRTPFGDYGLRKAAIERYLLREARANGFPATLLHPGHLVGPGWNPVNPQGNFNPDVFAALATGKELLLPNLGMETVHHVHADDVAHAFECALGRRSTSIGESFHVVSGGALTLRGYAEHMARWLGTAPNLRFVPWHDWQQTVSEKDARVTYDHIAHSPNCSIAKARTLMAYAPRYSSLQAVKESVTWMRTHGVF
jgi:nucleoside-diphosphate-sugar epimerase